MVLLTHQHMDHPRPRGREVWHSGAEVAALDVAVPYVEDYSTEFRASDDFAYEMMLRHGVPRDVASALRSVSRAIQAWGARADVSRVLRDGDELRFRDRSLRVHHRPGHSPTDTVFHDRNRGILIAGDHLLRHISSNPLLTAPRGGSTNRPQPLVTYLESLQTTRDMDLRLVLPGHGDPIDDHRSLIDERFAMHERRAAKLQRLVAERPRTAHDLAQALWGNFAVTQAFLTLSEVLGHVDLLLNAGSVREVEHDEGSVFESAEPR